MTLNPPDQSSDLPHGNSDFSASIFPHKASTKHASLSNPFLNNLLNHPDFKRAGPLKEVVGRLCESPSDYAILVPSTMFLMFYVDNQSGKPYYDLCKTLDFISSHIVRMNVTNEPRIRSHKEFTTLNNGTIEIKADRIKLLKGFKFQASVNIVGQEFIRGFANYIPLGTCFHVVYITDCLMGDFRLLGPRRNIMLTNDDEVRKAAKKGKDVKNVQPARFEDLIEALPSMKDMSTKFQSLFDELSFKKCKTVDELNKMFVIIMKRGSAMFNTLDPGTFNRLLQNHNENDIRKMIYNYLEANIYGKFWSRFLMVSMNEYDMKMNEAYGQLKWLSITQLGIHDNILLDIPKLSKYIKRVALAIREFRCLDTASSSSEKCKILSKTVDLLSENTTLDADTLIVLLIFVTCLAKVQNLNNHLKYMKMFSYSETDLESGSLGYAMSTFEISIKFFQDDSHLKAITSKSLENEVLWRLLGSISSDLSPATNKEDDERTFRQIEELLEPLNRVGSYIPLDHFIRSRTLNGESCLMFALKQHNEELMRVLLQFEYIFTLDDILEDQDIDGSNLLAVALDIEHPCANMLAQIVLEATPMEIKKYVNHEDSLQRTIGHYLCNSYLLIADFGSYIDWTKHDAYGNTPFMVNVRCYDHSKYDSMMQLTIATVKQWYVDQNRLFSHREHVDNKGNTLMHTIRDSATLALLLNAFEGLEINYLNDANQSAVSLAVRYNRIDCVEVLIKDPRMTMGIVDPVMFMSALDYVKLERWGECINRNIAKTLEVQFIIAEYGESLDIACVRARFEPEYGLCCYFRVVNKLNESDIILVPFADLVKVFKLIKRENPCIPFDFSRPDLWFPKHTDVGMKGNISSSNKMKINSLMNNLNLLIQALFKNGTLEHTKSLQSYLLIPQEPCTLEVKAINERDALKMIYDKTFEYKRQLLCDHRRFSNVIMRAEDIIAYEAFLEYTIEELESFARIYAKFYRTFALSDVEDKDLDKLRTDIPWIVETCLKHRECRVEDSSDILLDKLRLLFASVQDLIKTSKEMRTIKVKRWKKLISDMRTVRSELDRVAGSGVTGSLSPCVSANNEQSGKYVKNNRKEILAQVFKQIDILVGEDVDSEALDCLREDIKRSLLKEKNTNVGNGNHKNALTGADTDGKNLEELINIDSSGIGAWFHEKRRVAYVRRLLETFLKYRIEIVELDMDLRRSYENLAMFVSQFYQFRVDSFRNAFKNYAKGKIGELKREVQAWELGLREHKRQENLKLNE